MTGPMGLADAPACRMNDLAQAAGFGDTDPCPNGDQIVNFNAITVHSCSCYTLILPDILLDTVVTFQAPLSFVAALRPQTAVLSPLTPPPRTI
ncbi:MAG: hypothetical protein H6668_23125 [Ardenticatenaceae bacterium]|nr:hypothetical protein [Ardenticatenaceae bacterium]